MQSAHGSRYVYNQHETARKRMLERAAATTRSLLRNVLQWATA